MELKSVIYEEYIMDTNEEVSISDYARIVDRSDEGEFAINKSMNGRNMVHLTVYVSNTMCHSRLFGSDFLRAEATNSYEKFLFSSQEGSSNHKFMLKLFSNVNENMLGWM